MLDSVKKKKKRTLKNVKGRTMVCSEIVLLRIVEAYLTCIDLPKKAFGLGPSSRMLLYNISSQCSASYKNEATVCTVYLGVASLYNIRKYIIENYITKCCGT